MKKTVLIFGVSSFVGSNLVELLKDQYRIVGTYYKTPVDIPGVTCIPCDVLKKEFVMSLVSNIKPDVTIYAIGLTNLTECKNKVKYSEALNSSGAVNCLTAAERFGSKFVFLSSSYVLAGDELLYREGDTPMPNTVYGNSMSATEFYTQRSCLNYLILRCSPLYGWGYNPGRPTWFEKLQSALSKGESFPADETVSTGFLDVYILGKILKNVLDLEITNRLLQVSSSDFMTRYEFAVQYAKTFKYDESLIQKVNGNFPVDTSKNNSKVQAHYYYQMDTSNLEGILGTKIPKIEESLLFTKKRLAR